MALEILKLTLGPLQTNCYVVGDPALGQAVVIDPSDSAPLIYRAASERGWSIRLILATHGHFDHILGSAELKALTGAPFGAHPLDLPLIAAMPQRVREWIQIEVPPAAEVDRLLDPGETIRVGGIALEVRFTPGHSPGHVSFVLQEAQTVFSGDCLFHNSIGRTDLPGGDHLTLMRSIVNELLPLGDDYTVAPGHMRNTTIGYERAHNPFIMDYFAEHSD